MTATRPGPWLSGLRIGDDPDAWRAAGFTVTGDRLDVGGVTLHLAGTAAGRGLLGWQLTPPPADPVPGLPFVAVTGGENARGPARTARATGDEEHPNATSAVDHLVVATPDLARTTRDLARVGLEPRHTVVGARGDDAVAYRFFVLRTCLLELIGPADGGDPGDARFAGLAFATTAIDALGDLAGAPHPAVQPGRRIATLRTRELGISVPVAFLTPRPG